MSNRAFFKAYEHLASFDESRPLRAWLLRIAANEALNELRTRRRDAAHAFGGAEAEIELEQIHGAPDPGEIVSRRESSAAIRDAVSRLPEPQRVAVVLRYFADQSESQTAAAMGCSVGAVKSHAAKALARLRDAPGLAELMSGGVAS